MKKKKPAGQDQAQQMGGIPAVKTTKASLATKSENPVVRAKKTTVPAIIIDYPLEREIISSHHYTFRMGPGSAADVEIRIDGKDWLRCRHNSGYWWFDWHGYKSGSHTLEARVPAGPKRFTKTDPRQFTVLI